MESQEPVITIAICDSEPVAVTGMQAVLENVDGVSIVAVEDSLQAGIDAVRELAPTLLIVDKALGSQLVLDWIAGLRVTESATNVMVWGSSVSESEAVRFLQAGASGIVRKNAPLRTLVDCVLTVSAGGAWLDHSMMADAGRRFRASRSPLTVRELQVMALVERGFKNREIAVNLGIQTGTVKIHLKHIFEKTGIRGRYGLALSSIKEKGVMPIAANPN